MKKIINLFKNLLFPINCLGCNRGGFYLCTKCLEKTEKANDIKEDWIISVWSYKDRNIKRILWLLKFKKEFSSIKDLIPSLFDHLHYELVEKEIFNSLTNPILVPIPISKKKLAKRGYNQSVVIAKYLVKESAGLLKIENNILEKVFEKAPQNTIKNKKERFKNIQNTFKIKKGAHVKNKFIILVDDITTTHATLMEAKKILEKAGAKNIIAITIAH